MARRKVRETPRADRFSGHRTATVTVVFRRVAPACLALLLAACGGAADPGTPAAAPDATVAPTGSAAPVDADPAAAVVPTALNFSAPLVGGGDIELGALAGRPVLLWFWAPW